MSVTVLQRSAAGLPAPIAEVRADVTDAVRRRARRSTAATASSTWRRRSRWSGSWREFEAVNVEGTRTVLAAGRSAPECRGSCRSPRRRSPTPGQPLVGRGAEPADPDARARQLRAQQGRCRDPRAGRGSSGIRRRCRPSAPRVGPRRHAARRTDRRRGPGRAGCSLVDDGAALIDTTYVDNAATAIAQALDRCDDPAVHGRPLRGDQRRARTVREILRPDRPGGRRATARARRALPRGAGGRRHRREGLDPVGPRGRAAHDRLPRRAAGHRALVRPAGDPTGICSGCRAVSLDEGFPDWPIRSRPADRGVALPGFGHLTRRINEEGPSEYESEGPSSEASAHRPISRGPALSADRGAHTAFPQHRRCRYRFLETIPCDRLRQHSEPFVPDP